MKALPIILASSSSNRLKLLRQINIEPDHIFNPDVDETAIKGEKPAVLATRLSKEKMDAILNKHKIDGIFITADNVVSVGNRLLDKAYNKEDVEKYLRLYSGRKCTVYAAVEVAMRFKDTIHRSSRLTASLLTVKRLSEEDIAEYVQSDCGIGIAGGCNIDGLGGKFFIDIKGSYSGVVGLPLYETANLITHYQKLAKSYAIYNK